MRWNWDFIRNRRTDFPKALLGANGGVRPDIKMIMVNSHARPMQEAHLSDMEVAGQVRMLERGQLDHERVCTLARDRIVYLADRLGEIEALTAEDIGRAIFESSAGPLRQPLQAMGLEHCTFEESPTRRRYVKYGEAILALITGAPASDPDAETCIACSIPFKPDDLVLNEREGGFIHAACCGPEPESYFGTDGEPLKEGDLIPTPFRWDSVPSISPPTPTLSESEMAKTAERARAAAARVQDDAKVDPTALRRPTDI